MAFSIYIYRDDAALNPNMAILDDEQKSLDFKDKKVSPICLPGNGALITHRISFGSNANATGTDAICGYSGLLV
jgi:hypothetical protein